MRFIADLHIHSHYSISTSPNLTPEHLEAWSRIKGIGLVGTGDFTHPGWLQELKQKLRPAEEGLFRLKDEYRIAEHGDAAPGAPPSASGESAFPTRFLLTAEISNIYKKGDKVRKVHNLILAPDFRSAEKIQSKLSQLANISSDGRPIIGLDSRDLLEIALDSSERIFFVPAHIWTPWFSALGAKSGFQSIEECYGDLSGHIRAVETGLSSDPPMNWLCSFLDDYTLISNSDAHSPEKLGREANLFDTDLSYPAVTAALSEIPSSAQGRGFLGTIEFFPQEGKYHYDGHRKCGVRWDPVQTLRNRGICPVCGKPVTIGVLNRVAQLADRDVLPDPESRAAYHSLIPLKEILSELTGVGPQSKRISQLYANLVRRTGPELSILLELPVEQLQAAGGELLAEAIRRMRRREVLIEAGFDGEYGRVRLFADGEMKSFGAQELLFRDLEGVKTIRNNQRGLISFELETYRSLRAQNETNIPAPSVRDRTETGQASLFPIRQRMLAALNQEQRTAVTHEQGPALILAGPGTGKTRTLTARIAALIEDRGVKADTILAVTFTNKAAEQMKNRLSGQLAERLAERLAEGPTICTFHALGLSILKAHFRRMGREKGFAVIDEEDRISLIAALPGCSGSQARSIGRQLSTLKRNLGSPSEIRDSQIRGLVELYEKKLAEQNLFDLDDLIYRPVLLLLADEKLLEAYRNRFRWILVDEYQDINLAQYRLIRLLAPDCSSNLFVIGDPRQSIYGFRGADVRFINEFLSDYPQARLFDLTRSYRCSDTILRASTQVLAGKRSSVLRGREAGVRIQISENASDRSEAEFVARTIEAMIGGLRFFSLDSDISEGLSTEGIESLSDFAVLFRIGRQMDALHKAFRDHSIPCQTIGEDPFFKQQPVKPVIDVLRLCAGDNPVLRRSLLDSKIISPTELEDLRKQTGEGASVSDLAAAAADLCSLDLDAELHRSLKDLTEPFAGKLQRFVEYVVLGSGADDFRPDSEAVALMTLHSAKGLEFPCVFIVGCEDGLLPYSLFASSPSEPEEERRLFYVGMTRAKKYLFLSYAKKRYLFGREYKLAMSPFLSGIEQQLFELKKQKAHGSREMSGAAEQQLSLF